MFKKDNFGIASLFIGAIWLFFAVGFGYFGLLGFYAAASEKGFRVTLCGTSDCSNAGYYFSVTWLFGIIFLLYILPVIIVIYLLLRRGRRKQR